MLTPAERHAARTAPFRLGLGHGYGTPAVGYCPIGAVAVLRYVTFGLDADGEYCAHRAYIWHEDARGFWRTRPAIVTIRRATEDVLA